MCVSRCAAAAVSGCQALSVCRFRSVPRFPTLARAPFLHTNLPALLGPFCASPARDRSLAVALSESVRIRVRVIPAHPSESVRIRVRVIPAHPSESVSESFRPPPPPPPSPPVTAGGFPCAGRYFPGLCVKRKIRRRKPTRAPPAPPSSPMSPFQRAPSPTLFSRLPVPSGSLHPHFPLFLGGAATAFKASMA